MMRIRRVDVSRSHARPSAKSRSLVRTSRKCHELGEEALFAIGEHLADLDAADQVFDQLEIALAQGRKSVRFQRTEARCRLRYVAQTLQRAGYRHVDPALLQPGQDGDDPASECSSPEAQA
jgi:hypothetical protein